MMSFKQFLQEESVDRDLIVKDLSVKKAIKLLNEHCKDSLWMLQQNSPIWRGDSKKSSLALYNKAESFAVVDPSKTERRSQNTSNWYTIILDNSPFMAEFPKRSRSLICSTDFMYAEDYSGGEPVAIIPFDGVKIGVCPESDMWGTQIKLGRSDSIDSFNSAFSLFARRLLKMDKVPVTLETLKKMDAVLKKAKSLDDVLKNKPEALGFVEWFGPKAKDDFLGTIFAAYSPQKTKLRVTTPAELKSLKAKRNKEVWVGGPCVAIENSMWKKLIAAAKQK